MHLSAPLSWTSGSQDSDGSAPKKQRTAASAAAAAAGSIGGPPAPVYFGSLFSPCGNGGSPPPPPAAAAATAASSSPFFSAARSSPPAAAAASASAAPASSPPQSALGSFFFGAKRKPEAGASMQPQQNARRGGFFQRGGGAAAAGRNRAIRGPHRVPHADEMDDEDYGPPPMYSSQPSASQQPPPQPQSQLEAMLNAAPPPHGHPPSYRAAAAAAAAGGAADSVDLTQDESGAHVQPDVQMLGHTYNAFAAAVAPIAAYAYDAFKAAVYDPFAVDPYAAAFRSASGAVGGGYAAYPAAAAAPPPPKEISVMQFTSLSKEQQAVVLAIRRGENVFFSGCAGTGKSHLLKLLAQFLPKESTFFTASTGLAAVNIGGSTLHSFAGVGLGEGSAETLSFKARGNKQCYRRWMDCKVLVVDEISMISGQFFDKVETVARLVRRSELPFGGIQLVLSGDFLQLPPVKATKPTFRADCWERCIKRRIVLTKVFRQEGDPIFIQLLNSLRVGQLALKEEALLKKAHYTQLLEKTGVKATKLNSLKRDTGEENDKHLDQLPSETVWFKAQDTGRSDAHIELLRKNCPAPDMLKLRKGAQVMLLKNLDPLQGLCNGSRGVVVDFVSIHGDSGGFESENPAAAAAAAAAAASGDTVGINPNPYYADEANKMFAGRPMGLAGRPGNREEVMLLPRVQFENGTVMVIESDKWDITVQDVIQATRRQIPLTLAWALTIHKSQGMTLERAEINAQGIFENGQLYVAVSRVKSLKGLRLLNFTRDTMRTDMSVVAWYKTLERETEASTAELLKEVDVHFPQLQQQLEVEKAKNEEREAELKREAEIKRAGPFAQAAAAAAAAAAASPPAAAAAAAASAAPYNGFRRASEAEEVAEVARLHAEMKREAMAAPELLGGASADDAIQLSPDAPEKPAAAPHHLAFQKPSLLGGGVPSVPSKFVSPKKRSAPSSPHTPVGAAAPQPFRSPLRNAAAAAISTAIAAAELTGKDQLVSVPPSAAGAAAAPAAAASSASAPVASPSAETLCCCCSDQRADHLISPCLHLCLCAGCAEGFVAAAPDDLDISLKVAEKCPICTQRIQKIQKIFLA